MTTKTQSFGVLAMLCAILATTAFGQAVEVENARITTVAGSGLKENNGDAGAALTTNIGQTFGVEIGPDGALYICEVEHHRVRRLDLESGQLTTVAGNGKRGHEGEGGPATSAPMNEPYEVRFDDAGNMFVVEMKNHCVRRVDAKTKTITTVAGNGEAGFSGDNGLAIHAKLNRPHSIAIHDKHLFIADIGNHRIRRVDLSNGKITTFAGNGAKNLPKPGPIANQSLVGPRALFVAHGVLWIALREGHSVWKLNLADSMLSHVAGSGKKGYSGDGGSAKAATFNGPKGLVVDQHERVFVVDTENQVIRLIDTKADHIATFAGNGKRGFGGDGSLAISALFDRPHGICLDSQGIVYVGDTNNHRVRAIRPASASN